MAVVEASIVKLPLPGLFPELIESNLNLNVEAPSTPEAVEPEGEVPDEPEIPEVPDEPEIPEVPDEPEIPEVPDEPEVPEPVPPPLKVKPDIL